MWSPEDELERIDCHFLMPFHIVFAHCCKLVKSQSFFDGRLENNDDCLDSFK